MEEIGRLKSTISALDREKDGLQIGVDEKTERAAYMDDELRTKVMFCLACETNNLKFQKKFIEK